MANRDLTPAECATLESLVDATNVVAVLEALSTICGEKADHIQASYSDYRLARMWHEAEGAIGVFSCESYVRNISID